MERADLEQWKGREVARLLALVETERRYYQDIVASIPIGLLILSQDLSIVSANKAVARLFGLRGGDALRGRLDALFPGWVLDRVTAVLESGAGQTNIAVEFDSGKRRFRIGILPIRSWDDEAAQEALLSIEDISGVEPIPQLSLPLGEEPLSSAVNAAPVAEPSAGASSPSGTRAPETA